MEKLKILFVGQLNTGKSSLLNALIGSQVIISNYPGTTVEVTRGKKKIKNFRSVFILNLFTRKKTSPPEIK